jgi:phospholipase/carboxylesterase
MTLHLEALAHGGHPREASVLCVFVHGRTQSPEDMVGNVLRHLRCGKVAFALPRAAGNSWYAARAIDPLNEGVRGELAASLDYLHGVVGGLQRQAGRDLPLVIGGFSQGACLTLEYAMRFGRWNGAMVNFTGCRVGTAEDERHFSDLDAMPIYLTGSDADPWIPVHAHAQAAQALGQARARLRSDIFPGRPHSVCEAEIAMLDSMLEALAQGRSPLP